MKITNTNILTLMEKTVNVNTKAYREDLNYDIEYLQKNKTDLDSRRYLWMSRTLGTWCFKESEVYLDGTFANTVWKYYFDDIGVVALLLDIKRISREEIFGDVIILDYKKHLYEISERELPWVQTKYTFEDGSIFFNPNEENLSKAAISKRFGKTHGKIISCIELPADQDKLAAIIHSNKEREKRLKEINTEKFFSQIMKRSNVR